MSRADVGLTLTDWMGNCNSTEELQRRHKRDQEDGRQQLVQASPPLVIAMESPIELEVKAHEAETVEELLETLAVNQFDLTDSRRLTMEFGDVRMERQRTLVEIGMCDQAVFGVLGVAEAQEAEREAKVALTAHS